jgi:hypothetical protein
MIKKNLTVIFACLLPFAASACPDLTGSYLCKQNSYRKDTIYSFSRMQHQDNWVFEMQASSLDQTLFSSFQFLTDGVSRTVTDQITGQSLTLTATCDAQSLKVFGTAKAGQTLIQFSEFLSLNSQGDLVNESLDITGATVKELCQISSAKEI